MKFLIADDNKEMRSLLRRLCATLATEIRDVADGAEAIQTFGEFQPDWILMDISMPQVDGITATRAILASFPDARIVVLTEHNGPEYQQAALAAGACAFASKDNLQSLLALVSKPSNARANQ